MTEVSIRVKTSFTTPTGGWSVSLIKSEPQGINKRILLLEVQAKPPSPGTTVTQGFQEHTPIYDEKMTAGSFYEDVEIRRPDISSDNGIKK